MDANGGADMPSGGRFDFDDGGIYCGGWLDGKAHGHGVCTGPRGLGQFAGSWHAAFEVSGVYVFPGGSGTYEGQWQQGKRHGLGVETRGRWVYRGEWTQGLKGRYGVRQCLSSGARYEGTWTNGLQDGYGSETYSDGGTFQGQWQRGMRHGYGVRSSAPFSLANRGSLGVRRGPRSSPTEQASLFGEMTEEEEEYDGRGGFVLRGEPSEVRTVGWTKGPSAAPRKEGRSGTRFRPVSSSSSSSFDSTTSSASIPRSGAGSSDLKSNYVGEAQQRNVIETYMGEWKNDKRSGFGIAERSDGVKYEGEWRENKKNGYGMTTFKNGTTEEGKYANNVLVTPRKKKHFFFLRSSKFRQKIESSVSAAIGASEIALQKADIAISRTATARGKAEQAETATINAREDAEIAKVVARQFSPDFCPAGTSHQKQKRERGSTDSTYLQIEAAKQRSRSFYIPSSRRNSTLVSKELPHSIFISEHDKSSPYVLDSAQPTSQCALLDVFRNNPDRRLSTAGLARRPSIYVEQKISPRPIEQSFQHFQSYTNTESNYSVQEAVDEHFSHYYERDAIDEIKRTIKSGLRKLAKNTVARKKNQCLPLSHFYGIGVMEEEEEQPPSHLPRRSTLPSVLQADAIPLNLKPFSNNNEEGEDRSQLPWSDGVVRTGSLHSVPRRPHGTGKAMVPPPRKKSLPDINHIEEPDSRILTREAVAALSSKRREAIRKQEEEAEKLNRNPFLYLVSPELKDWLSRQQLLILVLFINISLAILFFKFLL